MTDQNNALIEITKAQQALERANDIHEMIDLRDKFLALQILANAKGLAEAAQKAKIYQLKAERKAGEWLKQNIDHRGAVAGNELHDETRLPDGIDKYESHRWQLEASVPEEKFNEWIDNCISAEKEISAAGLQRLAVDHKNTVTYKNQPGIQASHGNVPLAGTSHIYTVEKLLWPEEVESLLNTLLIGHSLHLCCGKSQLGDVRLDLFEQDVDIQADASHTGLPGKSFDTVLCDPPYNGEFQWNHNLLEEICRLSTRRIIFQHWFIPADPDGFYKKDHSFSLSNIFIWQPRTYFGRAQIVSIFDSRSE